MSRDEVLYSGQTSASFAKNRRGTENEEKLKLQPQILPVAELLDAAIGRHKEAIGKELANLINLDMEPEAVKSTVLGLRMASQRMTLLQAELKQIATARPRRKKKNE